MPNQKEIPMVELIVLYKTPNDPKHFEKYYREVHAPLSGKVHAINGIGDYKYGRVHALDGGAGEFFWYWSGTWESRQACLDAIAQQGPALADLLFELSEHPFLRRQGSRVEGRRAFLLRDLRLSGGSAGLGVCPTG